MITHRQIALAILRGRRFHQALKAATDAGPVTKEQFQSVAKAHKIEKSIPESYLISGILTAYELPEPAVEPEEVMMMEPDKAYLVFWKKEPDDELAYAAVIMTGFAAKLNAFPRFMQSCNLPATTICLHCHAPFTARLGKKYCSNKCRWLDHAHRKANPVEQPPIKTRVVRFLKSVREFIHSV
jgi:hypothetical protein